MRSYYFKMVSINSSMIIIECIMVFVIVHIMFSGATIAVRGSVNDDGFYCGSFQGKTGLVPSGFVQEMEIENSQQRRRLLNQTLTRPHIPSSPHTPHSSSRPASASLLAPSNSLFSPSGSLLTNSQLLQRTTGKKCYCPSIYNFTPQK